MNIDDMDEQVPLQLKSGDAIRLYAITKEGEEALQREGNLWTVIRVEAAALALSMDAGLLIAQGTKKKWLAFSDPDVYVEKCRN